MNIILGAHLNWGHQIIFLRSQLKLVGKIKLRAPGPTGSTLSFGAHLNWGTFKWAPKINIIVGGPFKLRAI